MNNTKESIEKEITNDFALSDLLAELIKANVEAVAQEVVSKYPKDQQSLDSAKLGAMECWTDRLCGLLSETDVQYLTELLEKKLVEVKERH